MSDTSRHQRLTDLLRQGQAARAAAEATAALADDPDDADLLALLAEARTSVEPAQALEPALSPRPGARTIRRSS